MEGEGITKGLMVVAIIAVALSAFVVVSNLINVQKIQRLAGFATDTDIGNATLTIQGTANINFSRNLINWSSGYVNASGAPCPNPAYAYLDTEGNTVCGVGWQTVGQGLVLDNIGNFNVSVQLASSNNATQFIGGGGGTNVQPSYKWKITNNLTGACPAANLTTITYTDVNITVPGSVVCQNLGYQGTYSNKLSINLNVTIPVDATPKTAVSVITATATTIT
ncbi:MAG: hypothetical protein AABW51_04235 [Nanoarchaeota archaeon]